eukprot:NODE_396_length_1800_cov_85.115934_g333_i0.p2 GENE.NODE_396_length_1800_cov_85.115934_g333_i0~~NODE_396_length_1800_cov_85.115934_g333_i0.p2  ORF type:complete len:375 (-),score=81.61 NODE_396_length_1800_cov_85.115934_g333_i0:53-1177(-)
MRLRHPMLPTNAVPYDNPHPAARFSPIFCQSGLSMRIIAWMLMAAKLAPRQGSSTGVGAPQRAMMQSPMNLSITPPVDSTAFETLSRYSKSSGINAEYMGTLGPLLLEYLDNVSKAVLSTGGVIDKFIGDCIMALWGAPTPVEEPCLGASLAAINIQAIIRILRPDWQKIGLNLAAGCGLSYGTALVGNMGCRSRMNYTAIGDNINVAARLEGLTRHFACSVLVTSEFVAAVQGRVLARFLGAVRVAGKSVPVKLYELLCEEGPLAHSYSVSQCRKSVAYSAASVAAQPEPDIEELLAAYYDGIPLDIKHMYHSFTMASTQLHSGNFASAAATLETLAAKHPGDRTVQRQLEIVRRLVLEPPSEWDGVILNQSK